MLKLLKFALFGLLGLVATILIVSLFLRNEYDIRTSIVIDAAPRYIYPDVVDLPKWREWSVWNDAKDPGCKHAYEGSGVGAKWTWDGEALMQGSMTLTKADPETGIAYDLQFLDFPVNKGVMAFTEADGKTTVQWSNAGTIPGLFGGWIVLLMESQAKAEYDTGLANLKVRAEKRAAAGIPVEASAKKGK